MQKKRLAVALAVVAVAAVVANAAVFVYYPATIQVQPQKPPVAFQTGTNSNGNDLNGTQISVTIGTNGTEAAIALHPTLGYDYYYDILQVKNNDDQAYYVNFYVAASNVTSVGIAEAYIVIDGVKYPVVAGQLLLANNTLLNAGQTLSIGVLFYTPDGAQLNVNGKGVIDLYLVYSPVNEQPQTLP